MRKAFVGVAICGFLVGCSATKDIPTAEAQISLFHQQLNAGQFDAVYTASAPDLKASATQDAMVQLLAAVHRKLGNFQSGSSSSWNDNVTIGGHFITIGYAAKYDRGTADENFVYRVNGDHAILVGYHITSNALIVN